MPGVFEIGSTECGVALREQLVWLFGGAVYFPFGVVLVWSNFQKTYVAELIVMQCSAKTTPDAFFDRHNYWLGAHCAGG